MKEKILSARKNGMGMMLLWGLLYIGSIVAVALGGMQMDAENYTLGVPLLVIGMIWACLGWLPFLGLKVLQGLLLRNTSSQSE